MTTRLPSNRSQFDKTRDTIPFDAPPDWQAPDPEAIRGRGTAENPDGRFERLYHVADMEAKEREQMEAKSGDGPGRPRLPRTHYLRDASRTVLTHNDSPDIHYDTGLNPYRGCEHGCVYCYARPTHEYLGMSAGLDFETRILIKEDAPKLLLRELQKRSYKPQTIGMSGVTDPYQPVERVLGITRGCLEVLADCRNPVGIITKNAMVTRDIDHLKVLAQYRAVAVYLSITTLDGSLHRVMEPRASHPKQRLRAVAALADAGIPVGVMIGPVIPGLTDHEIPKILEAAANAGAKFAGHSVLRLPGEVQNLFPAWLSRHFPDRKDKVMRRIRSMRNGKLDEPRFGTRMQGQGVFADQIHTLFDVARKRAGLQSDRTKPSNKSFPRPTLGHLDSFGP